MTACRYQTIGATCTAFTVDAKDLPCATLPRTKSVDEIGSCRINLGGTWPTSTGGFNALDDIYHAADFVVPGTRQLLHAGWLYPYLVSGRHNRADRQLIDRTKRRSLNQRSAVLGGFMSARNLDGNLPNGSLPTALFATLYGGALGPTRKRFMPSCTCAY
jgi:hypothetical protein